MIPNDKRQSETATVDEDGTDSPGRSRLPFRDGKQTREIGGRGGLDPVRYGDWEKKGRCIDF